MSSIIDLIENYKFTDIVIIVLLLFVGIKWIIKEIMEARGYIRTKRTEYHIAENKKEEKDEKLDEAILELKKHNEKQDKSISELCISIKNLNETIKALKQQVDSLDERQIKNIVASSRSTIYRTSNEIIEKGYMTQLDYEMMLDLKEVYLSNGGNHYVAEILLPKVFSLPVLNESEINLLKK